MMSIEADLFTALRSLVSDRVYPLAFPQTGAPPVWPGFGIRWFPPSRRLLCAAIPATKQPILACS